MLLSPKVVSSGLTPIPLAVGEVHSSEMSADQSLEFQAILEAGNAYLFQVDQGGFEIKVDVRGPGAQSHRFDFPTYGNFPTHRDERELLLVEPGITGPFTFRIFTEDFSGAVAHPRVSLTRVDAEDRRLPAYRLMTEAARLYAGSSLQDAQDTLLQAIPLLDNPSDAALLGRCQMGVAIHYYFVTEDYDNGREWFERAESTFREAGDELLAATALQFQATMRVDQAHVVDKTPARGLAPETRTLFEEALATYDRVLEVQRGRDKRFEAAGTLNLIGYTYWRMGELDHAADFYSQALEEYRELNEPAAVPWILNNLAIINFDRGFFIRAVDFLNRSLELSLEAGETTDLALWLDNLGAANLELGELDLALKYFSEARELHKKAGDNVHMGDSVQGIGDTYIAFGETELGMEYLESALPLVRQHVYGPGLVSLLNSLGRQYLAAGDFEAALAAHREAEQAAVNPLNRARTLIHLSKALLTSDQPAQALDVLGQAGQIAEDMQIRILGTQALHATGDALLSLGQFRDALEAFRRADAGYAELGLAIEQSQVLYGMSRCFAGLSETEAAVAHASRAIEAVESHRASLSTPQLRAFFMAQRQDYYAHLIAELVNLQKVDSDGDAVHVARALSFSERSRARSLVDLINETAQGDSGNGRNEQRDTLLRELAEARFRLQGKTRAALSADEIEATRQRLADIENRLNLLEIELREANPAYANLVDPTILDADGIQRMLDPQSALLQYALGSEKGFVFLVTQVSIQAWAIPGKADIEQAARDLYGQLRYPSTSREDRARLNAQVDAFARTVLPPAEALTHQRLLVVADGVLQYLPFPVLFAANGGDTQSGPVSRHEVINVPSMSVLAGQRRIHGAREKPSRTLSLYADPVFTADDRRVSGSPGDAVAATAAVASRQSMNRAEPRDLDRLPATAYEADTIKALVSPANRTVHTGFAASRENVLNTNLADYRVIHFATHGRIDSRYPALSWLAFSQVDPQGMEQNGLVRLHDIYNLDLNAELVTMSACDTALGREISGEGLTGLVQGFMYSGTRSVLASLWQVPDRATAELMGHFYRNLFEQEQKPAEALRNAQLTLSAQTRWRHPYFWSGFVLQGDWN